MSYLPAAEIMGHQVDSGRSTARIFGIISSSLFCSSSVAFKLNVSSARSDKYRADPAYAMTPRPMIILVRGVRARYFLSTVSNGFGIRSHVNRVVIKEICEQSQLKRVIANILEMSEWDEPGLTVSTTSAL